jgi:transcriptional regulator with GAF, ATPase, and Fis domain
LAAEQREGLLGALSLNSFQLTGRNHHAEHAALPACLERSGHNVSRAARNMGVSHNHVSRDELA